MDDLFSERYVEYSLPTFRHEGERQARAAGRNNHGPGLSGEGYKSRFANNYRTEQLGKQPRDRAHRRPAVGHQTISHEERARCIRSLSATKPPPFVPTQRSMNPYMIFTQQTARSLSGDRRMTANSRAGTLGDTRLFTTLQQPLMLLNSLEREPHQQLFTPSLPSPVKREPRIRAVHTQDGTLYLRTIDEHHDNFVDSLRAEVLELKHRQPDLSALQEEFDQLQQKMAALDD